MGRKDLSHFWMDATVNQLVRFPRVLRREEDLLWWRKCPLPRQAYEDEEWRVSGTQNGEKRFASSWKLDLGD